MSTATKPSYPVDSASIPGCGPNLHPEKAYLRWYNTIALHNEKLFGSYSNAWQSLPWLPKECMLTDKDTNTLTTDTTVPSSPSSSSTSSSSPLYKCLGIIVSRREHGKNLIFCNFEVWDTHDIQRYEKEYPLSFVVPSVTDSTNNNESFVRMDTVSSKPSYVMQMKVVSDSRTEKSVSSLQAPDTALSEYFLQQTPLNNKAAAYTHTSRFTDTLAFQLFFTRPGAVMLMIGNVEHLPTKNHKDFNVHHLQLLQTRPDPIYIHPLLTYAYNIQFFREQCKEYLKQYITERAKEDNALSTLPLLPYHLQLSSENYRLLLVYVSQVLNCTIDAVDTFLQYLQQYGKDYDKHLESENKTENTKPASAVSTAATSDKSKKKTKKKIPPENSSSTVGPIHDGNSNVDNNSSSNSESISTSTAFVRGISALEEGNEDTFDSSVSNAASTLTDAMNPVQKMNYQLNLVRLCRNINQKALVRLSGMSRRTIPDDHLLLLDNLEQYIALRSSFYQPENFRITVEDDTHGKFLIPSTECSTDANDTATKQWIDQILHKVHPRENLPEFTTAQRNEEYNSTLSIHANTNPSSTPQKRYHYIEDKKVPQIASFLYNLYSIFHYQPSESSFRHAVDIGGGRGDLAIAVAVAFPHVLITVIDINQPSLDAGKYRAKQLQLSNIRFIHGDVQNVYKILSAPWIQNNFTGDNLNQSTEYEYHRPDLFIGLHVCGSLTDWTLYLSGYYQASCILCPCCFGKHRQLHQSLLTTVQQQYPSIPAMESFIDQPFTALQILQNIADANETHLRPTAIRAMRIINTLRLYKRLTLGNLLPQDRIPSSPSSFTLAGESRTVSSMSLLHGLGSFPNSSSMKNQLIIHIQRKAEKE